MHRSCLCAQKFTRVPVFKALPNNCLWLKQRQKWSSSIFCFALVMFEMCPRPWRMETPRGCLQKMGQASVITVETAACLLKGEFWNCFWISLQVVVGAREDQCLWGVFGAGWRSLRHWECIFYQLGWAGPRHLQWKSSRFEDPHLSLCLRFSLLLVVTCARFLCVGVTGLPSVVRSLTAEQCFRKTCVGPALLSASRQLTKMGSMVGCTTVWARKRFVLCCVEGLCSVFCFSQKWCNCGL